MLTTLINIMQYILCSAAIHYYSIPNIAFIFQCRFGSLNVNIILYRVSSNDISSCFQLWQQINSFSMSVLHLSDFWSHLYTAVASCFFSLVCKLKAVQCQFKGFKETQAFLRINGDIHIPFSLSLRKVGTSFFIDLIVHLKIKNC